MARLTALTGPHRSPCRTGLSSPTHHRLRHREQDKGPPPPRTQRTEDKLQWYATGLLSLPFEYLLTPTLWIAGGSIIVKQIGHAILTVALPNGKKEEYLINFPRLRIDGLWYGSPYIELAETSHIIGGGYVTSIEYKGKGYFSGKSHSFKATVARAAGVSHASCPRGR